MGGNVRVGMEDNLYIGKGKIMQSNEEAVQKVRRLVEELSMEIAPSADVRKLLRLKGRENTRF
jgi:uncharacterized protein (DUF849 family)